MSHEMFGAVETEAKPVPLGETGDRTAVNTILIGLAVGAAVAGARVAGACVTGACVAGACVAGAEVAGASVGASVRGASDAVASVVAVAADPNGVDPGVAAAWLSGITRPSRGAGLPSRGAGFPHPASTHKTTQIVTKNRFPNSHPSLSDNCKGAA